MNINIFSLGKGPSFQELPLFKDEDTLDGVTRQLPQGLYSTFRTFGGSQKVLGLQSHLDRLFLPAATKEIEPSLSVGELRQGLRILLQPYKPDEVRIRICLSLSDQPGQVFVILEKLKPIDEKIYQQGVNVVTAHIDRENPRIKSTSFIQKSAELRRSLLSNDIYEVLMLQDDRVLEGLTSNFYALLDSHIITAKDGILLGVTRRVVLRLTQKKEIKIEYRPLRIAELPRISEAFITSSSRGVVPVVKVDGLPVGQGVPGKISVSLRRAYDDYVLSRAVII